MSQRSASPTTSRAARPSSISISEGAPAISAWKGRRRRIRRWSACPRFFDEQYRRYFRPRLDKRAEGFDMLFQSLQALRRSLLIVETGTLRLPGNWEGDGQSTFMFDALVRESGGVLISIDVTNESVDSARKACSSATQLITNDSVSALHALTQVVSK